MWIIEILVHGAYMINKHGFNLHRSRPWAKLHTTSRSQPGWSATNMGRYNYDNYEAMQNVYQVRQGWSCGYVRVLPESGAGHCNSVVIIVIV